jgi:hypothetical protein
MSKDESKGIPFRIKLDNSIKKLYFRLKGTYTNCDLSKSYQMDDIYFYNIKSKNSGFASSEKEKTQIIEAINSYHKKNDNP